MLFLRGFSYGHAFIWQSVKILSIFNILTLKQTFWKTKTFFKNLEYHFLVKSTKIENAWFAYKTAISEANAKTNTMVTTKWVCHKEHSLASNYVFSWKICFSFRDSYKELIWCTNYSNVEIHTGKFQTNSFVCSWIIVILSVVTQWKSENALTKK